MAFCFPKTTARENRNFTSYKELVDMTVLSVQLFSRIRAGEIERLKIVHFESLDYINQQTCPEIYDALNPIAKKYVHNTPEWYYEGKEIEQWLFFSHLN